MTKREWETRWRGKLASQDPRSHFQTYTTTETYYYLREVDGEEVTVSKWQDSPRREWVRVHRKDIIRFM